MARYQNFMELVHLPPVCILVLWVLYCLNRNSNWRAEERRAGEAILSYRLQWRRSHHCIPKGGTCSSVWGLCRMLLLPCNVCALLDKCLTNKQRISMLMTLSITQWLTIRQSCILIGYARLLFEIISYILPWERVKENSQELKPKLEINHFILIALLNR